GSVVGTVEGGAAEACRQPGRPRRRWSYVHSRCARCATHDGNKLCVGGSHGDMHLPVLRAAHQRDGASFGQYERLCTAGHGRGQQVRGAQAMDSTASRHKHQGDCQAELSTGPCSLELCSAEAEQTQQAVAVKDVEVAVDQALPQPPPDSTPVPLPPPQAVLSKAAPAESAGSKTSGFSPVAKT
ncbi:hypothetical protein HaLaN_01275, partial [Haematococcus lacustris]